MVSAGKLRKLWDSLSELRSSVCERRLERTSSEACAIASQNCAVYSVFPSGMTSHSKTFLFNWECMKRFTLKMEASWSTPLAPAEIQGHNPNAFTVTTGSTSTLTVIKEIT